MDLSIMVTIISIYGGMSFIIFLCLTYSVWNLRKINASDSEQKKNIEEILKNSKNNIKKVKIEKTPIEITKRKTTSKSKKKEVKTTKIRRL